MRLALLVLCSCGVLSSRTGMSPEEVVGNAIVDPQRIAFQIRYRWGLDDYEDRGHYELDRATGDCRAIAKAPAYPRLGLRAIKGTVQLDPRTTVRRMESGGVRYLEWRGPSGVRHVVLPLKDGLLRRPPKRVEWVVGTSLVLIDGTDLIHLETGRRVRVDGVRPFVIVGDRLFVRSEYQLVAYDLGLVEVVARLQPKGETDQRWVAPTPFGTKWRQLAGDVRVRKTATQLHVSTRGQETTHELRGDAAWIEGADVIVGEDWLFHVHAQRTYARPPGPLEVSSDGGYVRAADGVIRTLDYIPKHWRLGSLVAGGVDGLVLNDSYAQIIWLVSRDGSWRSYSYRDCRG